MNLYQMKVGYEWINYYNLFSLGSEYIQEQKHWRDADVLNGKSESYVGGYKVKFVVTDNNANSG